MARDQEKGRRSWHVAGSRAAALVVIAALVLAAQAATSVARRLDARRSTQAVARLSAARQSPASLLAQAEEALGRVHTVTWVSRIR
jgi:hypothetical protein